MKKIRLIIFIICMIVSTSASAFVPLVPLWAAINASLMYHVIGALSGFVYYMRDGSPTTVGSNGDLSRPSNAGYVDLTLPVPANVVKPITAKMPLSKARELADKKNSDGSNKYPIIEAALHKNVAPNTFDSLSAFEPKRPLVGDGFALNGSYYKISSVIENVSNSYVTQPLTTPVRAVTPGVFDVFSNPVGQPPLYNTYTRVNAYTVQPVRVSSTAAEFAKTIAGTTPTTVPLDAQSLYQAELDKMFQDPDYVPTFTDDTTGLPYSPPPIGSVASPEKVAAYNANGAAAEAQQAALNSSQNSATSAGNAATQAGNAYAASGGNPSTGVGGDPKLYQDYLDAKAKADAAQAELDKLKSDQATAAADDVEGADVSGPSELSDNTYNTDIVSPAKKTITDLLSNFVSNSPLAGLVRTFTISTSNASPVVSFGHVYGLDISVDFTRWQVWLSSCGTIFLIIAHGFAVMIVIRGW